jgi:hypothetical protein
LKEKNTIDDFRITTIYKFYDQDNDGQLTLDDFLKFYFDSSLSKEDTVRQNLLYLDYDKHLDLIPDEYSDHNVAHKGKRQSHCDMPRFKISSNQKYFDLLIKMSSLHKEVVTNSTKLI